MRVRRSWLGTSLLVVALIAGSCSPPTGPASTTTTTGAGGQPGSGSAFGSGRGTPPARWDHVVVVIFENKSFAQIFDPAMPASYMRSLAASCGLASDYWSVYPKSLANYLAITSGDTHGMTANPPPDQTPIAGSSIFQQLGSDWTVLAQSAGSNCRLTNNGTNYEPRHVPSLYYTAIRTTCALRTVPLGAVPDLSRRFTIIIPDKLNDMHMTATTPEIPQRIEAGDAWLAEYLPLLIASPEYRAGRTAIIVTFDEGLGSDLHVPLFVLSPYVAPGARDGRRFDHYSLLRTMQEMLGLSPLLGHAATAVSMRGGPLAL
jgi:hypothetical protein